MLRQLLLALLVISGLTFAQATVADAVEPYLFPGEPYVAEEFEQNGTGYLAVSVGGDYALLFENSSGNYSLVLQTPTVYAVLRDWKMGQLDIDSRVDALREAVLNFNRSRQPNENLCRQYTGLIILDAQGGFEERLCFYNASAPQPVESCLLACRTVPLCHTALANQLPAIYAMLYFKNATADINSNLTSLLTYSEQIRAPDPFAAELALEKLNNIIAAKGSIASNVLFTTYGFCHPIEFNNSALSQASYMISLIKDDFEYITGLNAVAERVVSFSKERSTLAMGEEAYSRLLYDSTVRLSDVRERIGEVLDVVDDPFTRNALDIAEYAYYVLGTAITTKDYLAADNAYHDFTVATENAEHAADSLEARVDGVRSLITNCTQTIYRMEQLDESGEYLGSTTRILARLRTLADRLNQTPMSITDFASLESSVKTTCLEAGTVLSALGADFFGGKLNAINENLENARILSGSSGQELNDSEVMEMLRQANASIRLGNFDRASELYDSALAASAALLAEAESRSTTVEDALQTIEEAEEMLAGMKGSVSYMLVKPDVSAVEATLAQAKALVYTDPERAKALAEQAKGALEGAAGVVALVNYAIFGAVLLFLLLIAAVAVALVMFRRRKKKR